MWRPQLTLDPAQSLFLAIQSEACLPSKRPSNEKDFEVGALRTSFAGSQPHGRG